MAGYCKDCGNQHCVCDISKSPETIFQDEVYKALGWQGGTIHQVIAEINRLKEVDASYKIIIGTQEKNSNYLEMIKW